MRIPERSRDILHCAPWGASPPLLLMNSSAKDSLRLACKVLARCKICFEDYTPLPYMSVCVSPAGLQDRLSLVYTYAQPRIGDVDKFVGTSNRLLNR